MQKFLRTLMLAALMLPFASQAQETVTIGDEASTSTQYYLPVNMYFHYSMTQQIFTAEEIGMAGTITSIAVDYTYSSSFSMSGVQVYMKNVSKTGFTSTTDMEPIAASDLVWTGTFQASASGWVTIDLDSPFDYDGSSNLLVCFYDPTNGYPGSSYKFRTTSTGSDYLAISYYSDSYTPSLTDVTSFSGSTSRYQYRNNIQLEIQPSGDITCSAVKGLSVVDSLTTSSSMTLKWIDTNNATGTSYAVYQINGTDTTEVSGAVITTTADGFSALISGLDPMTTYNFGVKANCGADGMSALRTTSGRTACAPYQLPFVAYFEATVTTDPCWSGASGMSADSVFNGGVLTLTTPQWSYASSDNSGIEAGHYYKNIYGTSCKSWMITPEIDLSTASAPQLSFDVALTKYNSATLPDTNVDDDKFMVLISTDGGATWPAANAVKWQKVGGDFTYLSLASLTYQNKVIDLSQYVGQTIRVAFYGESTISGGDNNLHIDNIIVGEVPTCDAITNLTVGDIFGRTADLTWSGSANSYDVEYKKASDGLWTVMTVSDTAATIIGLEPLTAYKARVTAVCGDGSSYPSPTVSFTTKAACQVPTNVTVAALAREATITWRDTIATAWQVQYINGTGAEADTSEIEDVTETTYTMLNLDPETPHKFRVRANCGGEDGESAWTPWKSFNTPVACQVPAGLTVTLTPGNGTVASISWTDTLAASWQLMLNSDSLNLIEVSETTYEFDNLTPEVTDTIRVRANCDNDGYSLWSAPVVFTPTNAYSVTVNDGTNTNDYVPIYGLYVDESITSRFIIPASSIAAMQYGSINDLTFYASQTSVDWGSAEFEVYMSTTSDSTVNTVNDVDGMTQVYTGSLGISDNKMVVTLNQPFQYMGDNLLIAFEQPTSGSYVSCSWYGVTANGASMGGYENDYGSYVYQRNFRPKTTFAYTPGEAPSCEVPTNLTCTDTTGHTATLTWEGSTDNSYVEYKEVSAPATAWVSEAAGSSPFTLTGLAHSTSYNIRVRVECDENNYYSNTITILTENTCVDPTNLVVMPVAGSGSSVLVSWTDTMASEWELFTMLNGDTTQLLTVFDSDTTGGYLVQNLIPEARYSVWVRAICDEAQGDISQWISTNFTPTASVRTTLGTPETTHTNLPTSSLYNYALTQQIYTAAELGNASGVITAVDFLNGGSEKTRNLDIYMIHTSDSVFENATDWFTVTAADKVFSGEVTFGIDDWTSITFDNPFSFNGDSNVVLVVDDNSGAWSSGLGCYVYTSAGNQAIYIREDGTNFNPLAPSYSGTLQTEKNHVRFAIGEPPACAKPTNVTLTSLGVTDATLTWNDTIASSWQIMVNGDATNLISATTTSYTFTNLTANTNYTVNVRSVCSAEEISEWSTPVTFRTYAPAAAVPYSTGFEAGEDDAWVFRNGTNAWMIGNATHNGTGTNALYISQNGTANTYNTGSAAVSYAFRTLDVATPGDYYCAFDWKANGESGYDYLRAWLVPFDSLNARANVLPDGSTTPYNYQTTTPAGWIDLGGKMNLTSSWQEAVRPANITVAGTYALVFMWANDGSSGSNPPAAVDNIWFGIPTCPVVTVAGVDSASRADSVIYFSWTPGGSETAWAVQYGTNVDTVSTPQYALQHIQGNGTFTIKVRALCSAEDQSFWKEISGKLPCEPDTVPFLNDFDNLSGTFTNSCWGIGNSAGQVQDGYQNWPYCIAFTGATDDKLLFLNKGAYVILPDLNVPLNQLYLSFDFSSGNDSSVLYLGYASCTQVNFEKVVFFDTLYHVDYATEAEFRGRVEMLLNNLPAEAHNLVIASDVIGTGHYVGLNELNLTMPPACGHVENVVATPVSETSATLTWTPSIFGTAQSYIVEYGPRLFTPGTGTVVTTTTNSITLTGLIPATPYQAYIVTDCGADTSEGILPVTFAGTCGALSVPDTFTFSEYLMSGRSLTGVMPNCWAIDSASRIYSEDSILAQVYGANSNSEMVLMMYDQAVVAMPAVNKPLDSLMLTFDMQIADEDMALVVGAVSSQANGFGATFMPIDTLRARDNGTVTSYLVNYAGNYQHIAFKNIALDTTVDASYVTIDNLVVSMAPTCLPIRHLEVAATTITSVTLDWDDIVSAGTWAIEYGTRGFARGTGTMQNVTSHPVTISGLLSATTYDFYVVPVCSATDHSDTVKITASTGCAPVNLPYIETFEGVTAVSYSAAGELPICWLGYSNGTNDNYFPHVTGSSSLYHYAQPSSSNSLTMTSGSETYGDTKIVALPLLNAEINGTTVAFWYRLENSSYGTLTVGYVTSDNLDASYVPVQTMNPTTTMTRATVDFSNIPATATRIAFRWVNSGTYYSVGIDSIVVSSSSTPIECEAPEVTIDTTTETSVTISIAGNAINYEVVAVEGNWDSEATGVTISNTNYTFNNLTAGTHYYIGVRSVCAAEVYSDWTVVDTMTVEHPCAVPTNLTATNVTLHGATLGWTNGEEGQNAWEIAINGTNYSDTIAVQENPYTVSGLVNGVTYSFSVRAVCSETNKSAWSAPQSFTTTSCGVVTNVNHTTVTDSSAVITWTAPAGATTFEMEYGPKDFAQGAGTTVSNINGTTYTITGLRANRDYDVYVRTVCDESTTSLWSNVHTFHTQEGTGIDDVNSANISLYPNPASSTVTLMGIEGMATVTVVDMNGRESGKWTVTDGTLTIDVTGMAQGAYFVRIVGEQVNAIRKLIVR